MRWQVMWWPGYGKFEYGKLYDGPERPAHMSRNAMKLKHMPDSPWKSARGETWKQFVKRVGPEVWWDCCFVWDYAARLWWDGPAYQPGDNTEVITLGLGGFNQPLRITPDMTPEAVDAFRVQCGVLGIEAPPMVWWT